MLSLVGSRSQRLGTHQRPHLGSELCYRVLGPDRGAGWELNPLVSQASTLEETESIAEGRASVVLNPFKRLCHLILETNFQCVLEGTLNHGSP